MKAFKNLEENVLYNLSKINKYSNKNIILVVEISKIKYDELSNLIKKFEILRVNIDSLIIIS